MKSKTTAFGRTLSFFHVTSQHDRRRLLAAAPTGASIRSEAEHCHRRNSLPPVHEKMVLRPAPLGRSKTNAATKVAAFVLVDDNGFEPLTLRTSRVRKEISKQLSHSHFKQPLAPLDPEIDPVLILWGALKAVSIPASTPPPPAPALRPSASGRRLRRGTRTPAGGPCRGSGRSHHRCRWGPTRRRR